MHSRNRFKRAVYLSDGRIVDSKGSCVFTDRVFADEITPTSGCSLTPTLITSVGRTSTSIGGDTLDNLETLFAEALADVESGREHPCGTTRDCR